MKNGDLEVEAGHPKYGVLVVKNRVLSTIITWRCTGSTLVKGGFIQLIVCHEWGCILSDFLQGI